MALSRAESRLAAMRSPYCLVVEEGSPQEIPDLLKPYYQAPWTVELRILYKDGEESRRQWLFQEGSQNRLAAVFTRIAEAGGADSPGVEADSPELEEDNLEAEEDSPEAEPQEGGGEIGEEPEAAGGEERRTLGFIELFGDQGLITMERQFLEDGELFITYTYRDAGARGNLSGNRQVLVQAETRRVSPEGEAAAEILYTDYYRYTRNYSLRLIERIFPPPPERGEAPEAGAQNAAVQLRFPRRSLDSEADLNAVSPVPAYGSRFLEELRTDEIHRVVYTTDERGRILTETREDEEGNILGEIRSTWSGDRLARVVQRIENEERVIEYEYNPEGDRIEERNYRNGVMERVVRIRGNREEEELYLNGEPILRALWEDGRKVHEEQIRSGRPGPRRGASQGRNP
jgi:YD repeat-containing protein